MRSNMKPTLEEMCRFLSRLSIEDGKNAPMVDAIFLRLDMERRRRSSANRMKQLERIYQRENKRLNELYSSAVYNPGKKVAHAKSA